MKIRLAIPEALGTEIEARAKRAGRSAEHEYGRLFTLGMLLELIEQLAPLFPEYIPMKDAPAVSRRGVPGHAIDAQPSSAHATASEDFPGAVGGDGPA